MREKECRGLKEGQLGNLGKRCKLTQWSLGWSPHQKLKSRKEVPAPLSVIFVVAAFRANFTLIFLVSGFVLKTIHSQDSLFPWWNFCSLDHSFPWTICSMVHSFPRKNQPRNIRQLCRNDLHHIVLRSQVWLRWPKLHRNSGSRIPTGNGSCTGCRKPSGSRNNCPHNWWKRFSRR